MCRGVWGWRGWDGMEMSGIRRGQRSVTTQCMATGAHLDGLDVVWTDGVVFL